MSRDDQDARLVVAHGGGGYTEAAAVGLAALGALLLITRGPTVADATLHLDTATSIVERGRAELSFDPGSLVVTEAPLAGGLIHFGEGGALRSSQPPGMAWLAVPFVAVGGAFAERPLREVIDPVFSDAAPVSYRALVRPLVSDPRAVAFALIGPIAGALTLAFVWLAMLASGVPRRRRVLVTLALFASPLGVYAGTCWTQPVCAAAVAFAAWWVLRGGGGVAVGIAVGVAGLVRPDHLVLALPFALALGRRGAWMGPGLAASVALLAWHGLPVSGGGWSVETLVVGVPGLLVSPLSGLLVYAPFVALAPLGASASLRWMLLVPAAQLAIYGGWFDWDATLAYGPRFLVPSLPVLALLVARVDRPRLLAALTALGALVCLPGHLVAHARIPETHAFLQLVPLDAWRVLLSGEDAIGPGLDCASLYVPAFAWLALAAALVGALLEAWTHRGPTPDGTV